MTVKCLKARDLHLFCNKNDRLLIFFQFLYLCDANYMIKEKRNKLFSILFLSVFFIKMVICAAPLVISQFNKQTVNAAIMQLEIENETKAEVKETVVKDYFILGNCTFGIQYSLLIVFPSETRMSQDKHVQPFPLPVPTPPPNVNS